MLNNMMTPGEFKEAKKKAARELRKEQRLANPKKPLPPHWFAFYQLAKHFTFNIPVYKKGQKAPMGDG